MARLLTESLSLPIIKATELDLHEMQPVKWQRIVELNSTKLKNKLNKHAAEQSEKLSDLKELQSIQFYKITTLDSIKC